MRSNALPEGVAFRDKGCSYHSACLTCPFERCRYDEPGGNIKGAMSERKRLIVGMRDEGMTYTQVADRLGVTLRTVYRSVRR